MSFSVGLAKINYGISWHTKEYYETTKKNEVDLHGLIRKDEGDISEKSKYPKKLLIMVALAWGKGIWRIEECVNFVFLVYTLLYCLEIFIFFLQHVCLITSSTLKIRSFRKRNIFKLRRVLLSIVPYLLLLCVYIHKHITGLMLVQYR